MNQRPQFQTGKCEIAGTEVGTLMTEAQVLNYDAGGRLAPTDVRLTLIPYYAWCHRGRGLMRVWLLQDLKTATTSVLPRR